MVGFYDLMGRKVANDRVLPKGIYIVITSEDGEIVRQKIDSMKKIILFFL